MNYYREHNIKPLEPGYLYTETESVPINNALTFDQLQETIGVPVDDLKFLNPQYKVGLIPSPASRPNMVRLPKKYVQPFKEKEQEIYAYHPERAQERERLYAMVQERERQSGEIISSKGRKTHVVRKGETLAGVARKYRVPVSQLIAWNDLKSGRVKPGQQLVVFKANGEKMAGKESTSVTQKGRKGKISAGKADKVKVKARGKGKAAKDAVSRTKSSKGRKAKPAGNKQRQR